jgi:hypothetical protein
MTQRFEVALLVSTLFVSTLPSCSTSTESQEPLAFTCTKEKTLSFAKVPSATTAVPDLTATGAPAPTVTTTQNLEKPWFTSITIEGTGFGSGTGGEFISFGSGAREVRVPAACNGTTNDPYGCQRANWTATRITLAAPFGAEGDIVVHTLGGAVSAGKLTPAWKSSVPFVPEEESGAGTTLATLTTAAATFIVRRAARGSASLDRLSIYSVKDDEVSRAALDVDGRVANATLVALPDGGVDLVFVRAPTTTAGPRMYLAHIRGNDIEVDNGCAPSSASAPLALLAGPKGGPSGWVALDAKTMARVAYDPTTSTWNVERSVPTSVAVQGSGVEHTDGSVAFAWDVRSGSFLDDKAAPVVAVLPSGASDFEKTDLATAMDDYVKAQTFATPSGIVMTWCNTDSTGLFDDKSRGGTHCQVLERKGPRDWKPAAGYADNFENDGYVFGLVGERVVNIHRVGEKKTDVAYFATPAEPGTVIASAGLDVELVRGATSTPILLARVESRFAIVRLR